MKGRTTAGTVLCGLFFWHPANRLGGREAAVKLKINGETCVLADGMKLADYLRAQDYRLDIIAVERNRSIVPKAAYGETVLCDGDELEIVSFMGGG